MNNMKGINRVQTGIKGLDKMLAGGLISERPYIVSGSGGSGKSIFGMQFLINGIQQGERVLFVALEEPVNEVKYNMESLELNFPKARSGEYGICQTLSENPQDSNQLS
jgi:KaiC/GvpD/RAD55 family RecA-like ATPase